MTKDEIITELKEIVAGEEEYLDAYYVIWDIQRLIDKLEKDK